MVSYACDIDPQNVLDSQKFIDEHPSAVKQLLRNISF